MPCNLSGIKMENIVLQEFTYLFRLYLVVKSAILSGWQKVKLGHVESSSISDFNRLPAFY